jgi:homoserine kinase type II
MATYTTFEREALERYLIMFDLGTLADYEPISTGIENSNYFVRFEDLEREFVLTITEGLEFDQVAFFNDLLQRLANGGLPVPEPQRTLDGMSSTTFKKKPTWLFNRLPGKHPEDPNAEQCRQIGQALAQLHDLSASARYSRENAYGPTWATESMNATKEQLDLNDRSCLESAVTRYVELNAEQNTELPRGIIHGDLFRDNALFEGDKLTGVIDFYHACDDFLVQDIAIAINDWCCVNGGDNQQKVKALLDGYESVRPLEPAETDALRLFREFGAMRFSLTRLLGGRTDNPIKNPREFLDLLSRLQAD